MENYLQKFDKLAGIDSAPGIALWLERMAFFFLILTFVSAPNSIAATQTAWLLGMAFWIVRFFFRPRPKFTSTFLLIPLLAYFGWSLISGLFSYAPDISLDRLQSVLLFVIFIFAVNQVKTLAAARFLAGALLVSCMVSVVWVPVERMLGRGVEVQNLTARSPLTDIGIRNGDTLVKVNKREISTPEELVSEIEGAGTAKLTLYRPDFYVDVELKKGDLLAGATALERLGVGNWKKSRNWRSAGFYGHYATYAEVVQLIASLALGLFIASLGIAAGKDRKNTGDGDQKSAAGFLKGFNISPVSIALFISVLLMSLALLLTATRAPQGAFLVSAFLIVSIGTGRKVLLLLVALLIPVIIIGALYLQQSRETGFFDLSDASTTWRLTVYREGFELWTKNARHFLVGVGMDSIKRYAAEWHLFDDGRLPMGHYHSTPLQLLVERGFPALIFWLWVFWAYVRKLFKALRANPFRDWKDRGIVLGSLGGAIGFFTSGLVHYNLGDAEVAMVFYLLMALSVFIILERVE